MSMGNASLYQPSQPSAMTPAPSTQPNTVFPTLSNMGTGSSTAPMMSGGSGGGNNSLSSLLQQTGIGGGVGNLTPGIGNGIGQASAMPSTNKLGQLVQSAISNPGMLQGLK